MKEKIVLLILIIGIGMFLLINCKIIKYKKSMPEELLPKKEVFSNNFSSKESKITLISLYDNYQINPELKTGWGFATLVKTSKELILFDTGGSSEVLLFNMKKMGIDPKSINKVVISHVHQDHLGGLEGFLKENPKVKVFIPASFPNSVREMIKDCGASFVDVAEPQKISDFIYTTGEIFGPPEEQSLIIKSNKGLIIITGCAHPGVLNIIKKAKKITGEDEVYLVLGGFHYPPLSVVEEFKKLKVKKVAPSHCTGDLAKEAFKKEYKENFIDYGVGKIIEIKT